MAALPPDVLEALRRGDPLEAMKLLRMSARGSPEEATREVERANARTNDRMNGRPSRTDSRTGDRSATPRSSLQELFGSLAGTPEPTARSVAATASTRSAPRPDALQAPREGDLSPGEVPRRGGGWVLLGLVLAALVAAWIRFRGG